jgi:dimethylhistidine N-methyltransferase
MLDYIIPASVLSSRRAFLHDVLGGLDRPLKRLPGKYLYDQTGRELFEDVIWLGSFTPARREHAALERHAAAIAEWVGRDTALIEYSHGEPDRCRPVLDALSRMLRGVPLGGGGDPPVGQGLWHFDRQSPIPYMLYHADRPEPFRLHRHLRGLPRRVVFAPGSTIGDFGREGVGRLLKRLARLAGPGGGVLVGVDHEQDHAVLERAYDDDEGLMRSFHLNLLARVNAELGGNFDLDGFDYLALHDEGEHRIDMHLVSLVTQRVTIARHRFDLQRGQLIRTAVAHKLDAAAFERLARKAGLVVRQAWREADGRFSVAALEAGPG